MPRETKKERDIMSKNLTRKGLALGAIVALGSSVIAGTPALAANELTVAPSAGTSYNTLFGQVFDLATTFAPGYAPANYAQLKYQIKTDANSAIAYKVGVAASAKAAIDTEVATPSTPAQGAAVAVSTTAVTGSTTNATALTVNHLSIYATAGTAVATSVEVTSFVDANNDGALTAGEWNSVRTINFKPAADIVPVVTLTQPNTGDTTLKATVAWGDLNIEQLADETVKFTAGTQIASATAGTLADGVWTKSATALAAAEAVTAQAYIGATAFGTAASATAVARTITSLTANVVKGADATGTAATTGAASTNAVVRTNGSFVASVKALDVATTPVAAPSVAVVASVTATTTATDLRPASTGVTEISITVNGVKYTSETVLNAAKVALTTDASGLASVSVSSVGLVATDVVTVSFSAQNLTSAVAAAQTDAVYTVTDDASGVIVAADKNVATTFNVSVKDQFGEYSARTNERLKVVAAHATVGVGIANQFVNVTAGKASFTVTPITDNVTDITVTPTLEISSYNASTGLTTYATGVTGGADLAARTIKFRSAAYSFATAPAVAYVWNGTASAAYNATSNYKQLVTAAALADLAAVSAGAANSTWQAVTLTGSNIGEKLTVSGTDVFLSIDGAAASANSATKVAQAAAATIYVASNTVGTKTLTITNGSVTKTVDVVFYGAAATAGTKLVVTVPANEIPGRTVTVSAKLTDKFGNPVDSAANTIAITASGAGYFVGTNATDTDADGVAKATFVNQSADAGTVVFTVKYTGTVLAADNLTTSASTVFAQPVVVDPSASVATVTVTAATTSQAGRALDVTVKAVDASGAAVAGAVVALSSTGAGSLSSASVVTGAAGTATVKLVAGASDLGAAVVTATSNAKSGSATVEFGATDASVDLIGKRVYVTTEFAAGKRVTIYDNGVRRYSAIQTSDAEKVVMWNVKAGSHTIVVKISGASSDSVTFLVK
jgi:trimeric autotransporter adhesin